MHKRNLILYFIISLIVLLQINEAIYGVALPKIAEGLNVLKSEVEATLISNFIGVALGILLWGFLADIIGSRKSIFLGLLVYISSTFLCWRFGKDIKILLILRFFQGFGISVASVMGQALIRTFIPAEETREAYGKINLVVAVTPSIGLFFGNVFVERFIWYHVFLFLFLIGCVILVFAFLALPKENIKIDRKNLFIRCIKKIALDLKGLRLGFYVGASLACLFGYYAQSAIYFKSILNVDENIFGILSIMVSLPLLLASLISRSSKKSPNELISLSIKICLVSSVCFYAFSVLGFISNLNPLVSAVISFTCISFILFSAFMITPNCLMQMLEEYQECVGTAASIFGFYYYIVIAFFMFIISRLNTDSIYSLPIFFLITSICLFLFEYFVRYAKSKV